MLNLRHRFIAAILFLYTISMKCLGFETPCTLDICPARNKYHNKAAFTNNCFKFKIKNLNLIK